MANHNAWLDNWIMRYFSEEQVPAVKTILSEYRKEPAWQREPVRVWRDAIIISRGSLDRLRETIELAKRDYRDVLVGEEVDPWVIGELKKYGRELPQTEVELK